MNKISFYFFFVIFVFCVINSFSQQLQDTLKSEDVDVTEKHIMPLDTFKYRMKIKPNTILAQKFNYNRTSYDSIVMDTLQNGFQIYNPAFQNKASNVYTGNFGAPFISSLFSEREVNYGFFFAQNIKYNFHKPLDITYYKTRSPYTHLTYFTGGPKTEQEQHLKIVHTQNVSKNWNISFWGDLKYSDGQFSSQKTKSNCFSLSSSYKNYRYSVNTSASLNNYNASENGGIRFANLIGNDYDTTKSLNERALSVSLDKASTSVKNKNFNLVHRFYITGESASDSLVEKPKWNDALSIIHIFNVDLNSRNYIDMPVQSLRQTSTILNTSKFYNHYYFNTYNTHDSTYFNAYENTVQLALNGYQWLNIPAEIRLGIKNEIIKYGHNFDTTFILTRRFRSYNSFVGSIANRFSETLRFGAEMKYYINGEKWNDLELKGDLEKTVWKVFTLRAFGKYSLEKPTYFFNEFQSNNSKWAYNFDKVQTISVSGGLFYQPYKISLEGQQDILSDYVYFGEDTIYQEGKTSIVVTSMTGRKRFDVGWFHSDFRLTLQNSTNDSAVSIPKYSLFNSTYVEVLLFKVLNMQFGADVFYNASYYSNAYNPSLGVFYNQSIRKTESYPYVDVFANFKLKRARFFVKYENILNSIFNERGYYTYGYPNNRGILKFGLSWTFYD